MKPRAAFLRQLYEFGESTDGGCRGGGEGGKAKEMGVIARSLVPGWCHPPGYVRAFSWRRRVYLRRGKGGRVVFWTSGVGFPLFLGGDFCGDSKSNFNGFLEGERGVLKPCQDGDMTRPESLSHLVGGAEKDGCGGGFSHRV